MRWLTKTIKPVSFMLVCSILTCTAPIRTANSEKLPYLSGDDIRQRLAGNKQVRFVNEYGVVYEGHIIGWNETGFIGQMPNRVDTINYNLLSDIIQLESQKTQAGKGAKIGSVAGLISYTILALFVCADPKNNNGEFGDPNIFLLTYAPLLIGGGLGLGAIIGAGYHQYDNYRYDKESFKANPWILPEFSEE